VVVLRRGDENGVSLRYGSLERRNRLGIALRLDVGIVERNGREIESLNDHSRGRQVLRGTQQRAVVRPLPEAAGEAENADGPLGVECCQKSSPVVVIRTREHA